MAELGLSNTGVKSWLTQRLANRLPVWSRAREREDSFYQLIVNPFAQQIQDLYVRVLEIRSNYYVPSADTNEIGFSFTLSLPEDFLFNTVSEGPGDFVWDNPTVTGVLEDNSEIDIAVISQGLFGTDKNYLPPTRISTSLVVSDVSNTVVAETTIGGLGEVTLPTEDFDAFSGRLYIDLDEGTQYGVEDDTGSLTPGKIIITGEPVLFTHLTEYEEDLFFPANTQRWTADAWKALSSLEVSGIPDLNTKITVTRGFIKDFVTDPLALWIDDLQESPVYYSLGNAGTASDPLPILKWVSNDLADADLQAQGLDERITLYEQFLGLANGDPIELPIALERMPFSPWLLVITQENLYVFRVAQALPTGDPGITGANDVEALAKLVANNRSVNPELILDADRNWLNPSEDLLTGLRISTRRVAFSKPIHSTRLSRAYFNGSGAVRRIYLDWDGNQINIETDPQRGFIPNPLRGIEPEGWNNVSIVANPISSGNGVEAYILETKLGDGSIVKDAFLVHVDTIQPLKILPLPAGLQNNVQGMTYDHNTDLLVLTNSSDVYKIDMHWDYCSVDFRTNTVYLREDYSSVEVVA